jgi:DHA2 family multidrug resistance protein-like MFS transporter
MIVLCFTGVDDGFWALITGFALFNLGAGPLTTLGTSIVIGSVAQEKAGTAAGVSQTGNEFGFALGVAIVGSIGTFVYRLQTTVLPGGLSMNETHAVRETLATAVQVSDELPAKLGSEVLHIARGSFVEAYHVVAIISAIALVAIATVIILKLKKLPPIGQAEDSA